MFAANTEISLPQLEALFDDEDSEVREAAAMAVRRMEKLDEAQRDTVVKFFILSLAADEHLEQLVFGLAHDRATLPSTAIQVCERAVEVAEKELGDIRTSWAAASRDIIAIVLQLYRQGDPELRGRCLGVIDRLSELGALGLAEVMDAIPRGRCGSGTSHRTRCLHRPDSVNTVVAPVPLV